jgi:4a-hydroxytetrahydrobiopterin dehydratase
MEKVTDKQLQEFLKTQPNWVSENNVIIRKVKFKDFKTAFSAMTAMAFEAEALGHHPEWTNVYSSLDIRLSTHDEGNTVTTKDTDLAKRIEHIISVFE